MAARQVLTLKIEVRVLAGEPLVATAEQRSHKRRVCQRWALVDLNRCVWRRDSAQVVWLDPQEAVKKWLTSNDQSV